MSIAQPRTKDVINAILGADEGGRIADLRNQKPELSEQLQDYYLAVFDPVPASAAAFPLGDRLLTALRVAAHTRSRAVIGWYADRAVDAGVADEAIRHAQDVATPWTDQTPLGAAIRHADRVTTNPSSVRPEHLQALKDAGFTPAGILSLAQTIAFVSYQLRLIAGLHALGASS